MKYQLVVQAVNKVIEAYTTRLTVRQLYYRIISPPYQMFANNLNNYKGFDKILTRARERGDIDWTRIEDRARRTIGGENSGSTYDDPSEYIDSIFNSLKADWYSKKIWETQPKHIEVWVEKDALSSLFYEVLEGFRIRLFPSRGYSSFTSVMEAIGRFNQDKPVTILHFTDHDPSGLDMTRDLDERFLNYADKIVGGAPDIEMKRIALSIDQVQHWELAPNPTKEADKRSSNYVTKYGNQCWELDAVPPDELQTLVRKAVLAEIDQQAWDARVEEINEEKASIAAALLKSQKSINRLKSKIAKLIQNA